MLIILPTYKRFEAFDLVLKSLAQANIPDLGEERLCCCVIANSPENAAYATKVFDEHKKLFPMKWDFDIIYRNPSMPPAQNWYSAMLEKGMPDELVIVHGDDDFFLKNSLITRHKACVDNIADLVICKFSSGLLFLEKNTLYFDHKSLAKSISTFAINSNNYIDAIFISANTYRLTHITRAAIQLSYDWSYQHDWVPKEISALMLPLYIPYAIHYLGGTIVTQNEVGVIRGRSLREITEAPFGVPGWNSGFVSLLAYGIFSQNVLTECSIGDGARRSNLKMACQWYATFFMDKRLPRSLVKQTLKQIRIPLNGETILWKLQSIARLAKWIFKLNGMRAKQFLTKTSNIYKADEFLKTL